MITVVLTLLLTQVLSRDRQGAVAAKDGREVFEKRCAGCHALDSERAGPRLRTIYGRKAATAAGFPYSDALKNATFNWTAETLDKWLADPDEFLPGNDMAFRVPKPEERAAIIEYLKSMNSTKR
jgi:cytochrome c